MNKIAIGIHFDSLGEAYNFPENFQDPSFFNIMDRFLEISSRREFRYTIYVIGKDLENKANASQVKKWVEMGHEIGSHSWSHPVDLSLLTKEEIHEEIYKAHEIITRTTGVAPKGFAAPGWAYSDDVYDSLISLNYLYDASVFSSWVMIPLYLFWLVNFRGSHKFKRFFRRGPDAIKSVFAPKDPFIYHETNGDGSLYILPTPITKTRIACWHSLGFVLGWNAHFKLLRQSIKESKAFYYTMHACDMIAPSDLNNEFLSSRTPRTKVSIEDKKQMFEHVLDIFEENGKQIVTIQELAGEVFPMQEYKIQR
jgi:peptidoglycan-N-acetylglucosamine deacetylase